MVNLLRERGYTATIEHARHFLYTQRIKGRRWLMTDGGVNFGKLLAGMGTLFVAGTFTGWFTALLYNAMVTSKLA